MQLLSVRLAANGEGRQWLNTATIQHHRRNGQVETDYLAVEAVCCEPVSLTLNREFYREKPRIPDIAYELTPISRGIAAGYNTIPYLSKQGILKLETRNAIGDQTGNSDFSSATFAD